MEKTEAKQEIVVGDVMFFSSKTTYLVMVNANGLDMKWSVTTFKNNQINFVLDMYCEDRHKEAYMKLKRSVKRKIRQQVENAVNLLNQDQNL